MCISLDLILYHPVQNLELNAFPFIFDNRQIIKKVPLFLSLTFLFSYQIRRSNNKNTYLTQLPVK